jgi:hypothetical protein
MEEEVMVIKDMIVIEVQLDIQPMLILFLEPRDFLKWRENG